MGAKSYLLSRFSQTMGWDSLEGSQTASRSSNSNSQTHSGLYLHQAAEILKSMGTIVIYTLTFHY